MEQPGSSSERRSVLRWSRPRDEGTARDSHAVVGATGFEPATSRSQSARATKLRHTPLGETLDSHQTSGATFSDVLLRLTDFTAPRSRHPRSPFMTGHGDICSTPRFHVAPVGVEPTTQTDLNRRPLPVGIQGQVRLPEQW